MSIRESMAAHLRSVAEWRRWRYNDFYNDPRNLRSAAAIDELAEYVLQLPDDDLRLRQLAYYAGHSGDFLPGQQTNYAIGRFHFFHTDVEFDDFLDHLVELAEQDFTENGRFAGTNLPPGDDPWA